MPVGVVGRAEEPGRLSWEVTAGAGVREGLSRAAVGALAEERHAREDTEWRASQQRKRGTNPGVCVCEKQSYGQVWAAPLPAGAALLCADEAWGHGSVFPLQPHIVHPGPWV